MRPVQSITRKTLTVDLDSASTELLEIQRIGAEITTHWQKSVESILEVGHLLLQAKSALAHGNFVVMIEEQTPFSIRTAQMLMKVAHHPVLANAQHVALLPPSWGTLAELARVEPADLEQAIAAGTVRPDMSKNDTREVVYRVPQRRKAEQEAREREEYERKVRAERGPEPERTPPPPPLDPGLVLRGLVDDLAFLIESINTLSAKIREARASGAFGESRLGGRQKLTREKFEAAEFLHMLEGSLARASWEWRSDYDDLARLCGLPTSEEM